jgi:Protein involved in formate dehydrogenase formation
MTSPWLASRRRAEVLRDRHPFGVEVLTLYLALLDVWEETRAASEVPPEGVADWAAEHVLPQVVRTTVAHGPEPLAKALADVSVDTELLTAWLSGADLDPVERYLARATLRGLDVDAMYVPDPGVRGDRHCPTCGGPPQLSFRTDAGDRLASGRRHLQCARCAGSWSFSSSTCASCGETAGTKRIVYSERRPGPQVGRGDDAARGAGPKGGGVGTTQMFPHLRIEGCESCRRYLIDIDLGRDPRAVPEVDELAALPLDLYAAERGLTKITPNLMGF